MYSVINPQWQSLCDEESEAVQARSKVLEVVQRKLAVFENPTEAELAELRAATNALEDVRRRMHEFAHAGKKRWKGSRSAGPRSDIRKNFRE